jgi:hypothetical protein
MNPASVCLLLTLVHWSALQNAQRLAQQNSTLPQNSRNSHVLLQAIQLLMCATMIAFGPFLASAPKDFAAQDFRACPCCFERLLLVSDISWPQ